MTSWSDAPNADSGTVTETLPTGWTDQPTPLNAAIQQGTKVQPEQAAKVLKLQSQTGLDPELIKRNIDDVSAKVDQPNVAQLEQQSPNLAGWIAKNYLHMAIAGPDLYNLQSIEGLAKDVGAGAYRGSLEMERSAIGLKGLFGAESPDDAAKVTDIERRIAGSKSAVAPAIYGTVAEQAPIMAGATGIGATAAFLGGVGVPAAGVATAAAIARGSLFGASTAGGAYLDYKKLRDENNQPLNPSLMRGAALSTGVLNAILQEKTFAHIVEKVPAFQSLMPSGIKSMLQSQTLRAALGNYFLKIGEQAGAQGGVSWITAMAQSGGGELSKMMSDGTIHQKSPGAILSSIFNDEAMKNASKQAKSGIATGAAMAFGYGAYDFAKNYTDIIHATEAAKSYEDMGNKVQNLKMLQHSPEKTEEAIKEIVGGPSGDGPNRNTYVPIRDFNEHYQGKGVDPREAFGAITGSYSAYDEASRTGSDLQIPTEKYLTTIGAVPEDNKKLSQVLRTDPEALNAQEAEKGADLIKKERGEDPAEKIKDAVMNVPAPLPTLETEPITEAPIENRAVSLVEQRQGFEPLFKDAKKYLPPDEAEKYIRAVEQAHGKAQEELAGQIIDRRLKEKSRAWNNERDDIEGQVLKETQQRKEYNALDFLRNPIGSETLLGKSFKLDRNDVIVNDITNSTKGYPSGIMSDTDGLPVDAAAEYLGFNSGSEMLYALKTMPKLDEYVQQETDRRMLERHPDATSGANIVQEAMKAVHSEHRSKLLITELRLLATDQMAQLKGMIRRITRPVPTMQKERADAEADISAKQIQDIKPSLYSQAESVSAREAGIHLSNGDLDAAFESKYRELLANERYRAAVEARETIDKGLNTVKRLNKESVRDRIAKASGGQVDYLGQIDDILDRFDFRKSVSLKALTQRESLRDFVQREREAGYSPTIPESVLNEANKKHFKEMSLTEFNDVIQSLESIQKQAELKGKLLANLKERDFNAAKRDLLQEISENYKIKTGPLKPRITEESHFIPAAAASQKRMEFMIDQLAGDKPMGKAYQLIFKPTVDAQNAEREMMIDKMVKMGELSINNIFKVYSQAERAQWYNKKIYIPEIDHDMLKPNLLMVGLNQGNPYNKQALDEGYKWSPAQRDAVLSHLDERDWSVIQKLWDHSASYWDDIVAQEKALNGQAPERVEFQPFKVKLKDGKEISLRGGYFPILFDKELSPTLARLDEAKQAVDLFGGQYAQAMTKFGHTIARVGTAGRPLSLNMSNFTSHLENVIHDLAWRKTIIDLNHIINDPEIRSTIKEAIGDKNYAQLNPWLRKIAGEKMPNSINPFEQLTAMARGMGTATNLGLSVTAGLKHMTNFGMTVHELGPLYSARGFAEVYAKPYRMGKLWEQIASESKVMAAFDESYDRDLREQFSGLNVAGARQGFTFLPESVRGPLSVVDSYTHNLGKALFYHFGLMYKAVSMPAYVAAKMKALDGKVENVPAGDNEAAIDYAEHVVRTTIASGATKDLPNIMNERGLMKNFTMYYGPMNLVLNNFMKATRQSIKDPERMISALAFIWFGPAAIQSLITGKAPGLDDPSEDWIKWLIKTEVMYPFEGVVGARDIARWAETKFHDTSLSPIVDVPVKFGKSVYAIKDLATGDKSELGDTDIKNIVTTVGYFTKLPTTQMYKTADYIMQWLTGDQRPDNPMEGIWRSLVGAKR